MYVLEKFYYVMFFKKFLFENTLSELSFENIYYEYSRNFSFVKFFEDLHECYFSKILYKFYVRLC